MYLSLLEDVQNLTFKETQKSRQRWNQVIKSLLLQLITAQITSPNAYKRQFTEPGTAPESKEDLEALFSNRLVKEKINSLGIRYVVNIRGGMLKYNYTDDRFEIPGVFAFLDKSHEKRTDAFVSVCDLKESELLLKTESHAHDTEHVMLIGFLPLWIPAKNTDARVCEEIANRLIYQLRICDSTDDNQNK